MQSKLQHKVDSTGQGETYAVVAEVKDAEWARLLFTELGTNPKLPIDITVERLITRVW